MRFRRTALIAAILGVLGVVWLLQDAEVGFSWEPDWPATIRGVGLAQERIEPGPSGEITQADRERASERARWKAYYYAQLRLAEQLGNLKLDATTTIMDLGLADQQLNAAYEGTMKAARQIHDETRVEFGDGVVTARVVVEAPTAGMQSFRSLVATAVRSGRFRVQRVSLPTMRPTALLATVDTDGSSDQGESPDAPGASSSDDVASEAQSSRPAVRAPRRASMPEPRENPKEDPTPVTVAPAPVYTGCLVYIPVDADTLGTTSTFYDAGGTVLGTSFDLPRERLVAGVPMASAADVAAIENWAGTNPRSYGASISMGDLFLRERLSNDEARFFRQALRDGRVVFVLGSR